MDDGAVPAEGISAGTSAGSDGHPLSFINAEWINQRISRVAEHVNALLDRLIDDGLLGSGYPPFETPVTDEMLMKMTPEQFRTLYDSVADEQGKATLFERMKGLKLPPREFVPQVHAAHYTPPVAGIGPSPVESTANAV
jgi:hypothetical protein